MNPITSMFPRRGWPAWVAAAAVLLLAACGGGGTGAETPIGSSSGGGALPTSVTVAGTVTGFGSVIIDGIRYDDNGSVIGVDQGGADAVGASLADLKLGMSVDAVVDGDKLVSVTVRAAMAGPIDGLDLAAGTFSVYGQTVKVATSGATPTLFEGVSGLSGLALNDRVEVHGTIDDQRALVATRVERKPLGPDEPAVRVGGVVTALDASARTFRFNDLTVSFASAVVLPADLALANGQQVVVFADAQPAAGRLTARAVRIKAAADGALMIIGGRITDLVSTSRFSVGGVAVLADGATLEGGVAADLAAGKAVTVEGRVANGVLTATKLRFISTPVDALASLKGEIVDFLSPSSFKLRGTAVDASAAIFVGASAAELVNGALVKVQGVVDGDVFRAEQVEFLALPAEQTVRLTGQMLEWNPFDRQFTLQSTLLSVSDATVIEGGILLQLASGLRVSAEGTVNAQGVVEVRTLKILPPEEANPVKVLSGRASAVALSSFTLGDVGITHSSATVFEGGTFASLVNGAPVIVKGVYNTQTGALFATWVYLVDASSTALQVGGAVSDFVSVSDFRVNGQRVDASSAQVVDGQVSALADGVFLLVTGELVDRDGSRVFVASRVRFLN
jgi:hypothetical protein